jgi:hypothetical protein
MLFGAFPPYFSLDITLLMVVVQLQDLDCSLGFASFGAKGLKPQSTRRTRKGRKESHRDGLNCATVFLSVALASDVEDNHMDRPLAALVQSSRESP